MSFICVCSGLNAGKPPAPEQRVRFLLGPMEGREEKELTLTATSVPTLTDHLLGKAHSGRGLGVTSQEISAQRQFPIQRSDSCPSLTRNWKIFQLVNNLGFAGSTLPLSAKAA